MSMRLNQLKKLLGRWRRRRPNLNRPARRRSVVRNKPIFRFVKCSRKTRDPLLATCLQEGLPIKLHQEILISPQRPDTLLNPIASAGRLADFQDGWRAITTNSQDSSSGMEYPFPGSSEVIRQAFGAQTVPSAALEVMIASLAPSTIKQYTRPLRTWWTFCQTHGISPYAPDIARVLEFLSQELRHSNSYSTLNTARSAISLISSTEIGNHPLVKRFCKGASYLKPPKPRYDFIWDPAPVIANLATMFPYTSISLPAITKKLVLLLALESGQRAQTLAYIKISQLSFSRDKLLIRIPDRIKTSGPGRAQPVLSFSRFLHRPELCIITLLEHYLDLTKELRPANCDSLFLSYVKLHKSVEVQTISR
ncbi:hypothetical protein DMN91_008046 [Ooceraea biroi]|uniref:Core-binding (CB) domain-containing protein n=1 Tax=Ooceraea biroi TaxID=2015173 RepID=A0A3L8DHU2_OOCBI|nr:uncharacterized protein LOC105287852 isoform X1 [Ooceraea biroi]RLU19489.1 hypothetical protein DMN91_008046 [Ooceraea biroi]